MPSPDPHVLIPLCIFFLMGCSSCQDTGSTLILLITSAMTLTPNNDRHPGRTSTYGGGGGTTQSLTDHKVSSAPFPLTRPPCTSPCSPHCLCVAVLCCDDWKEAVGPSRGSWGTQPTLSPGPWAPFPVLFSEPYLFTVPDSASPSAAPSVVPEPPRCLGLEMLSSLLRRPLPVALPGVGGLSWLCCPLTWDLSFGRAGPRGVWSSSSEAPTASFSSLSQTVPPAPVAACAPALQSLGIAALHERPQLLPVGPPEGLQGRWVWGGEL